MKKPKYSELDKVDKYLMRFTKTITYSTRSGYYNINGNIIRVSDHIGRNSDGVFHIIIRPNAYLIYHQDSAQIEVVSYKRVLEFIRVITLFKTSYLSAVYNPKIPIENDNRKMIEEALNIDIERFTNGEINAIADIIKRRT